ncbi:MAG TPA: Gfo/Idh/MocA family oxidoreductase [Acidimicrobiales bacterium]|nr:Gfo/Idh/MocA family oxidoreductase [Acidimicrobiales bacterium]
MTGERPVRWGILGTANIARRQFLPALAEVGGGRAVLVAGRDGRRVAEWAAAEGVEAGVAGYETVLGSGEVDVVYIALPNSLHAEWTVRALSAGKAVLCEKMLCRHPAELGPVLEAARRPGARLWEAFVFPFQNQHQRLLELVASGTIGDPCEIVSSYHFRLTQPSNIRLNAELGGGALADVGCYPVRLAQELIGPPPEPAQLWCEAIDHGHDVETDASAIVAWGAARLMLSVGFHRSLDTFTRVIGTTGELRLTNPYHPGPGDTLTVLAEREKPVVERPTTDVRSFSAMLRHIHRVLAGDEAARQLAVEVSAPTATAVAALQKACRPGRH